MLTEVLFTIYVAVRWGVSIQRKQLWNFAKQNEKKINSKSTF
jgi:hypothetical protein